MEYAKELLEPGSTIEGSKFFGGLGIRNNSAQFSMIMGNSLYFVVGDSFRTKYEKQKSEPFPVNDEKRETDVQALFRGANRIVRGSGLIAAKGKRKHNRSEDHSEAHPKSEVVIS